MKNLIVLICLAVYLLLQGCYYDNKEDLYQYVNQAECTVTTATFSANVVTIIAANCTRCHRTGREDGGVNLEGYNNVKRYANNGQLFGTTNHEPGYKVMPTSGVKIPFCDIEQLRIWIENGSQND